MIRPEMTAVLVTPGRFDALREAVDHLAAQRIADRLEIIVVSPSTATLQPDPSALACFHGWSIVETGPFRSTSHAIVAGVRRASAPVVIYVEEHVFPEPDWAGALVEAHEGPWAAVGPSLVNANPASRTSWAALVVDYGAWVAPVPSGEGKRLSVHNSAFRRDILLALGEELEALLEGEILFDELRARGHRFYLEARARCHHLNVSRPLAFARAEFLGGRLHGAGVARRMGWSPARRVLRALAEPGALLVRLVRRGRHLRRLRRAHRIRRGVAMPFVLGLASHAAGEAIGFLAGSGHAGLRRLPIETDRRAHLRAGDRNLHPRHADDAGGGFPA